MKHHHDKSRKHHGHHPPTERYDRNGPMNSHSLPMNNMNIVSEKISPDTPPNSDSSPLKEGEEIISIEDTVPSKDESSLNEEPSDKDLSIEDAFIVTFVSPSLKSRDQEMINDFRHMDSGIHMVQHGDHNEKLSNNVRNPEDRMNHHHPHMDKHKIHTDKHIDHLHEQNSHSNEQENDVNKHHHHMGKHGDSIGNHHHQMNKHFDHMSELDGHLDKHSFHNTQEKASFHGSLRGNQRKEIVDRIMVEAEKSKAAAIQNSIKGCSELRDMCGISQPIEQIKHFDVGSPFAILLVNEETDNSNTYEGDVVNCVNDMSFGSQFSSPECVSLAKDLKVSTIRYNLLRSQIDQNRNHSSCPFFFLLFVALVGGLIFKMVRVRKVRKKAMKFWQAIDNDPHLKAAVEAAAGDRLPQYPTNNRGSSCGWGKIFFMTLRISLMTFGFFILFGLLTSLFMDNSESGVESDDSFNFSFDPFAIMIWWVIMSIIFIVLRKAFRGEGNSGEHPTRNGAMHWFNRPRSEAPNYNVNTGTSNTAVEEDPMDEANVRLLYQPPQVPTTTA
mmetsp:Transcript_18870/g.27828  ORF Transcript_18870/g.27828 Transcript_18870/m.27828 type:complete len:555 (-) Transcript_18870:90-1754(-)|eukprot:CAMPEP_0171461280 /NCGR_PEP_ID=MMETSP0945-20130129/5792_1 /TAXON_ID=109269 /ORGANISM="Vaucheria litorea, Strain CCMP2940" /LENGTH=554 /DNA_ID=CAMNT_0011987597 /DNA_START=14 /DNA_END=1678 /DNA_ORIENTATION=-